MSGTDSLSVPLLFEQGLFPERIFMPIIQANSARLYYEETGQGADAIVFFAWLIDELSHV